MSEAVTKHPWYYDLPTFDSVEDERLHRKQRLAAAFRLFSRFGFDEGAAGHASARDPEHPDHFWINPPGMHFGHIRVSDLLLVSGTGETLVGDRPVDEIQFSFHAPILAARPDVVTVAHTHCMYGRAWSTLMRLLDPITQDVCAFYEDHTIMPDYRGVVHGLEEGRQIADALGGRKAVILSNHGLVTVGQTVDAAAFWLITMERSCHVQMQAEAIGTPRLIDHVTAAETARDVGSPEAGWFNFQPLFDRIVREQPDLLS